MKPALIVGAAVVLVVAAPTIAGCTAVQDGTPVMASDSQTTSATAGPTTGTAFDYIEAGDCLMWPDRTPDSLEVVSCDGEHRFEVATVIDLSAIPGGEFGPRSAPPSAVRIQQISQEQCTGAAERYLGPKYDPNSRFTTSLLWSGERDWEQAGERRVLCGLQLTGPNYEQLTFGGRVAELDQSKVWPPGTCIGIDPTTNQPTDIPVDCAAPHSMEVTGSVDLGARFPGGFPPDAEQDPFVKDECTTITDAYLAPVPLRSTTLTLIYSTIAEQSWSAGSRQVSCSIGATTGDGRWATLLNSAKGPLLIDGQPPAP